MRLSDFHASTVLHVFYCEINILSKVFDFTTLIAEKEYHCKSIALIYNANSIAPVAEGRLILVLQ